MFYLVKQMICCYNFLRRRGWKTAPTTVVHKPGQVIVNFLTTTLIVGGVFVCLSTSLTLAACMLSSRISQTEEFVERLTHAVDHQLTKSTEYQVE